MPNKPNHVSCRVGDFIGGEHKKTHPMSDHCSFRQYHRDVVNEVFVGSPEDMRFDGKELDG